MNKPDIREYLTEQSIIAYREHVIEECARVAGKIPIRSIEEHRICLEIATAIRALKDKP